MIERATLWVVDVYHDVQTKLDRSTDTDKETGKQGGRER